MKKLTLALLLLNCLSAYAQNDSTRLDVGGVVLKRAFTQNISIKGEDMEKMPFTNLSEAISTWLYGLYTDQQYVTYVVDGNILSDVNSYSIHDIEEVVLVQNAAALTGTGSFQQQVVLITTRKGKGRRGIQGAAQTSLVHNTSTTTNLYHQYYVSGYENLKKVSFGFSANYLRDISPGVHGTGYTTIIPDHLDRWRLNGSFIWRPDTRNTIEAHIGFTPQNTGSRTNFNSGAGQFNDYAREHGHTNLLTPWLRWHGEWAPGLKNDLQAGLLSELSKSSIQQLQHNADAYGDNHYHDNNQLSHTDHVYIRDRISYEVQAGGWLVTPSFNASYEHFKDNYFQTYVYAIGPNAGPGNYPVNGTTYSTAQTGPFKANLYLLTPAVDLTYKHIFDVQGGAVVNSSPAAAGRTVEKRVFPFASATIELLRTDGDLRNNSLKLFGSYAQRDAFIFNDYTLPDLTSVGIGYVTYPAPVVFSSGTVPISPVGFNLVKNYWSWQTGASFASRDNRWEVSYHFERSNFTTFGTQSTPTGTTLIYSEWRSSLHSLGLRGRIVDGTAFGWQSGATAALIRDKTGTYGENYLPTPLGSFAKDNNKPSVTGGWTNRLRYKHVSMGVDMLYHVNREIALYLPSGAISYTTVNIFQVQNIFLAYRLHLQRIAGLEVYVDVKRLAQSNKYNQLDGRRYYGIGGKVTI